MLWVHNDLKFSVKSDELNDKGFSNKPSKPDKQQSVFPHIAFNQEISKENILPKNSIVRYVNRYRDRQ